MTLSNKPTAADLVLAVRQHLEERVLAVLQGSDAFHVRIALNALGIIERELREGPGLAEADTQELLALLGTDNASDAEQLLVEKLRSGELDVHSAGLLDYLAARTQRRLIVDNPRYRHEKI